MMIGEHKVCREVRVRQVFSSEVFGNQVTISGISVKFKRGRVDETFPYVLLQHKTYLDAVGRDVCPIFFSVKSSELIELRLCDRLTDHYQIIKITVAKDKSSRRYRTVGIYARQVFGQELVEKSEMPVNKWMKNRWYFN